MHTWSYTQGDSTARPPCLGNAFSCSVLLARWEGRFPPVHLVFSLINVHGDQAFIHTRWMAKTVVKGRWEVDGFAFCHLSPRELKELDLESLKSVLPDTAPQAMSWKHHLCAIEEKKVSLHDFSHLQLNMKVLQWVYKSLSVNHDSKNWTEYIAGTGII